MCWLSAAFGSETASGDNRKSNSVVSKENIIEELSVSRAGCAPVVMPILSLPVDFGDECLS